jgi:glyoxylase-like metal-dependent hydrolase (beta-lactamase superfamily II)
LEREGDAVKIGEYDIYPIDTGTFWLDGGAMFGVMPWVFWSKTNPPDNRNRVKLAARCLLLQGNGRTILIDTGNGEKWNKKQRDIYGFDNSKVDLLSSMKKVGIQREDVTNVILTHLHFDHTGGSTTVVDGKLEPTFPNAKYHIQKKHWEHAQRPTEKDRASFFPENYQPLAEKGLLELVEGDIELFPGIEVLTIYGHTNSLQLPKISNGKTTLLFCSDLIPLMAHLAYPSIPGYDLYPLTTLEEKKRIFQQAFDERWILFLEHDPQVQAVTLKQGAKGYEVDQTLVI